MNKPRNPKHGSHTNQEHKHSEKESTNRHVYVEPGVQIDFVKDFRDEYKTAQNENTARNKKQLSWTIVSAVLIFIYAGLTAWMGFTNWRLLNTTRQFSEREERAFVAVHPTGPLEIAANQPLGFPFRFVNTGKTPARHIVADMWVQVVPIDAAPDLSENGIRLIAEIGDLFPSDVNLPEIGSEIRAVRQQATIPRSHETRVWPMGEIEDKDFGAGRNYVVAYMRINYEDVFHVKHWTRYCIYHVNLPAIAPPAIGNCAAYREDDNEEP